MKGQRTDKRQYKGLSYIQYILDETLKCKTVAFRQIKKSIISQKFYKENVFQMFFSIIFSVIL